MPGAVVNMRLHVIYIKNRSIREPFLGQATDDVNVTGSMLFASLAQKSHEQDLAH